MGIWIYWTLQQRWRPIHSHEGFANAAVLRAAAMPKSPAAAPKGEVGVLAGVSPRPGAACTRTAERP